MCVAVRVATLRLVSAWREMMNTWMHVSWRCGHVSEISRASHLEGGGAGAVMVGCGRSSSPAGFQCVRFEIVRVGFDVRVRNVHNAKTDLGTCCVYVVRNLLEPLRPDGPHAFALISSMADAQPPLVLVWTLFAKRSFDWRALRIVTHSAAATNRDAELRLHLSLSSAEDPWPAAARAALPPGARLLAGHPRCAAMRCWVVRLACMRREALAAVLHRRVVLLEADQFVAAPLAPAFDAGRKFDVGLTFRTNSAHGPINSGLLIVHSSAAVVRFFDSWTAAIAAYAGQQHDRGRGTLARRRCGSGDDQLALAQLTRGFIPFGTVRRASRPARLPTPTPTNDSSWDAAADESIEVLSLPCSVYNAEFKYSRCNHPAILRRERVVVFHFNGANKAFQGKCERALWNYSAGLQRVGERT